MIGKNSMNTSLLEKKDFYIHLKMDDITVPEDTHVKAFGKILK